LRVRGVSGSCVNSVFEEWPRRACGLAVCLGTTEGTRESKEFMCELAL